MVAAGMGVLALLVLVHGLIGSERIVLIECGLAMFLPLFSFSKRWRMMALIAPFAGAIAILILFAFGEYTRSWPYYHEQFDSFGQFVGLRLLAYVAVASNSGAGMVLTMPTVGYPFITARWLTVLPIIGIKGSQTSDFYHSFGNAEFNNPSGIFAAIVDFGSAFGILYLFLFGLFVGVLYGFYRRQHAVGMLAYPLFFTGLADLTQIWYWGEPRFVPQLIFLALAIGLVVYRRRMWRTA